jgi:hypothetical protein
MGGHDDQLDATSKAAMHLTVRGNRGIFID